MTDSDKRTIEFGHLPKVEKLLKELEFCSYSTQLRNTCYDIQYLYFLEEVLGNDFWYGGFKAKLQYERLKTCFGVCESILYCLLVSKGFLQEGQFVRFPELLEKASRFGFLDEYWFRNISRMKRLRNQHHASAQRDLEVKFGEEINSFDIKFINSLITQLSSVG